MNDNVSKIGDLRNFDGTDLVAVRRLVAGTVCTILHSKLGNLQCNHGSDLQHDLYEIKRVVEQADKALDAWSSMVQGDRDYEIPF
jgi:hypothetical protein